MRVTKIISICLQVFIGVVILVVAGILLADRFGIVKTVKPYVVMSGSMGPAVRLGSVVIVRPQASYSSDDVVTYAPNGDKENPVTHRILFKQYPEGIAGEPVYLTKGDANEDFDRSSVKQKDIIGKALFAIPYLGYAVDFAKRPYGFIFLVIIPATIVVYEELKIVGKELVRLLQRARRSISLLRNGKNGWQRKLFSINLLPKRDKGVPKAAAILPMIGATLVLASFSASFFSDIEQSTGNIFTAGTWGPTIAQTLVINEVLPNSSCTVGEGQDAKPGIWLEVYNGYDISVDLKDFDIFDGTNTIALLHAGSLTLNPGEFALLAHDQSIWNRCEDDRETTTQTGQLGTGSFNLNSQFLQLRDPSDVVIDTVQWAGVTGLNPTQNQSIERVPAGMDSAAGINFEQTDFIVRENPTPGYGTNIVLNEFSPSPSPTTLGEWVEIYNPGGMNIDLTDWSLKEDDQSDKDLSSLGLISPSGFAVYDHGSGWLNNSGPETLQLKNPSGKVVDSHFYSGSVSSNLSVGREIDRGNIWKQPCTTPTKGTTNNGSCL